MHAEIPTFTAAAPPTLEKRTRIFIGITLTLLVTAGACLYAFWPSRPDQAPPSPTRDPDSLVTVRLAFVGDLMCHQPQFEMARLGPDSFDFRPCYAEVKSILSDADLTFGNLETTLSSIKIGYSGYPTFNSPDEYLDAIQDAGFDFLVTSNNHSVDKGEKGILRTLERIRAAGIASTGTFTSQADRDSLRIVDLKGMKMAVLNYTYGTNGIPVPAGKPWLVNLIDSTLIAQDLARARKAADLVLVFYHYGLEYLREPEKTQKQAVAWAQQGGADLIIGSHPHVLQPMNYYATQGGARLDSGFVAWSLGNFLSNQNKPYTDAGAILKLELTRNKNTGQVWISRSAVVPTWVYRGENAARKIHTILPAQYTERDSLYPWLDAAARAKLRTTWNESTAHLRKYSPRVEIDTLHP